MRSVWCLLLSFSVAFNLLASVERSAISHNVFGSLSVLSRRTQEATVQYEQALRLKPDYAFAHNNLANLLAVEGQLDAAIGHYRLAVAADPKLEGPHHNLALLLREKGDFNGAIEHLRSAIELDPGRVETRMQLGETLISAGRYAEASASLREGLELQPQNIIMNNDLAWLLATCPQAPLRDGQQAVQISERLVATTDRKMPEVLDTLAAAYAEAGRFDDAVKTIQEALAVSKASGANYLVTIQTHMLELFQAGKPFR